MLCCTLLCCAMLCCATLCCAVLFSAVLYHAMLCHAALCGGLACTLIRLAISAPGTLCGCDIPTASAHALPFRHVLCPIMSYPLPTMWSKPQPTRQPPMHGSAGGKLAQYSMVWALLPEGWSVAGALQTTSLPFCHCLERNIVGERNDRRKHGC